MSVRSDASRGDGVEAVGTFTAEEVSLETSGRGRETGSGVGPRDLVDSPRWNIEECLHRYRDMLRCCRFKAMALFGSSLSIYDQFACTKKPSFVHNGAVVA